MRVPQNVKKVLKSALVLAMAFALCGTTLAKAYATYFSITVEHIWKDNGNQYGEGEENAPTDGTGPRDAVGNVEFECVNDAKSDYYLSAIGSSSMSTGIGNGSSEGKDRDASNDDAQGSDEADTANHADTADDAGAANDADAADDASAADDADSSREPNVVSMELDINVEASPEAAAMILADNVTQQLDTISDASLSEEQTDAVAAALADAIALSESDGEDYAYDPANDVWTDVLGTPDNIPKNGYYNAGQHFGQGPHSWDSTYSDIKGSLTEATQNALKENGYETELTITVKIAKVMGRDYHSGWVFDAECHKPLGVPSAPDKTYISTDGGETWVGEDGQIVDSDTLFTVWESGTAGQGEGWAISECKFTFVHTRAASYAPEEKPEDPDPTDPDPTDPDPTDPDPENPTEEIPDPDVPLAEPELPQEEPPAEEPPEEIELEDPDVPLADIPETGDISDLWYGAALMMAAGLSVLLYQERRSRKTA